MMDSSFYPTLVELAKLGASGVGVAIFLMAFFLLVRGKPIDPATGRLTERFMLYGLVFALALLIIPPTLQLFTGKPGAAPISERLAFSPDFATEQLPPPTVRLPDGTETKDNVKFDLQPGAGTQVVTVAIDGTLDKVKNLRQASATLASTVEDVTKQRDTLAAQAAAIKPASDAPPPTPALQNLQRNSSSATAIQQDVIRSLNAGQFARANQLTRSLNSSVHSAAPAVAVIAGQRVPPPSH
jgi:hypothetical protein